MNKLPEQPKSSIDPVTGRRIYEGSLSSGITITPEQATKIHAALVAPKTPAELAREAGISDTNPHAVEAIKRLIAQGVEKGTIVEHRDDKGRLAGWKNKGGREDQIAKAIAVIQGTSMSSEEKVQAIAKLQGCEPESLMLASADYPPHPNLNYLPRNEVRECRGNGK